MRPDRSPSSGSHRNSSAMGLDLGAARRRLHPAGDRPDRAALGASGTRRARRQARPRARTWWKSPAPVGFSARPRRRNSGTPLKITHGNRADLTSMAADLRSHQRDRHHARGTPHRMSRARCRASASARGSTAPRAAAGVTGRVRNDAAGVTIDAFGAQDVLDAVRRALAARPRLRPLHESRNSIHVDDSCRGAATIRHRTERS